MPATPVRQSVLGVARKLASPRVKAAARRPVAARWSPSSDAG